MPIQPGILGGRLFALPESAVSNRKETKAMVWLIVKVIMSAVLIVAVSEISNQMPRLGALLLSLPLISILAFIMTWNKSHDMATISKLATETLILVPLGLPFFLPLAFSGRTGLSFWPNFAIGILLASITIGAWLRFAPQNFP